MTVMTMVMTMTIMMTRRKKYNLKFSAVLNHKL